MIQPAPSDLIIVQGGGPTPVLNATLFGAISQASLHRARIPRVIGARHGVEGLLSNDLVDLTDLPADRLELLRLSPGASLGSTRHRLTEDDLERIVANLRQLEVHNLLIIGGNGTLHGAELIARAAHQSGYALCIVGVPKTIDNDIPQTDRCPGFASAARYVAQSVRDLAMDVRALPQPVSIFETMGRDAGWLTASSLLARIDPNDAPHLVYLPESAFHIDAFLDDLDRVVIREGYAIVVVSEGIRDDDGHRVFEIADPSQRDALGRAIPGGVAAHLAGEVTRRLGIRCRFEQPGLCGRASMLHISQQDLIDAEAVGRAGIDAILQGFDRHMVALEPLEPTTTRTPPARTRLVPLEGLGAACRRVDPGWLGQSPQKPVNDRFIDYVRPLVSDLLRYATPLMDSVQRVDAESDAESEVTA